MMKKIIALALALSMALSMVAFAGYTDAEQINADLSSDIDLVAALGVMQGNPDGSFNPQGYLTRGEAATILYRLSSGKKDIDASWGDASLSAFTDMAGHWSLAYVNYCHALGLVNGDPAGTFRPDDYVTGAEMAKMLLNVAGYSTEKQGYGNNWPMVVLADATNAGLLNEYGLAFNDEATREWVAKLLANLILDVNAVHYNSYSGALEKDGVFGTEKYGVKTADMYALANEEAGIVAKSAEDYSRVGKTIESVTTTGDDADLFTIKFVIPTELLGHKVKVYYKGATLATATKIYDVVDAATTVIDTTMDKVYVNEDDGLVANGVVVDKDVTSNTVKAYLNLTAQTTMPIKVDDSAAYNADARPVELVKQDDVWYGFYNAVNYVKITDAYDATDDEINLGGTEYDADDLNILDELAEDDIAAIETLNDGTYVVSKINVLRTTINSYTAGTSKTFKIGATSYKKAATVLPTFDYSSFCNGLAAAGALDETYDIYAVGNYVVYAKPYTSTFNGLNTNIAFAIDTYVGGGNSAFTNDCDKVQVMFADGSIGVYEYEVPTGVDGETLNENMEGKIYEYKLDGAVMYFTKLASAGSTSTGIVKDATNEAPTFSATFDDKSVAKSFMAVNNTVAYANDETFFFVVLTNDKNEKSYEVIKASELVGKNEDLQANYKFTTTAAYVKDADTGLNTLAYAVLENKNAVAEPALPGTDATSGDYFIVTGSSLTKVVTSDKTVWTIAGINGKGEKQTLTITGDLVGGAVSANGVSDIAKGKIYEVETKGEKTYLKALDHDADGSGLKVLGDNSWNQVLITAATKSSVILSSVTSSENVYSVANSDLYDLADDVNIVYLTKSGALKTSGLPTSIPFVELKATATEDVAVTVTLTGDNAGTYTVYKTARGTEVIKIGEAWMKRSDATKDWTEAEIVQADIADPSKNTVKTVTQPCDGNIYSYVLLNADGVVTDIVIALDGETQVSVDKVVQFVIAADPA